MASYNQIDSKILFRIDFKPTLKYFDQMFEIASTLEGDYEHWKASTNPSAGLLFDKATRKTLNVSGQTITFSTKDPALIRGSFEQISALVVLFLGTCDITEIARVGFRRLSINTTNKPYDEFSDHFFEEFYGAKNEIKEIMADKVEEVLFVLQAIKDGFHNRNQFGPIKAGEIERLYGIEEYETLEDLSLKGKTGILVDTDLYSLETMNVDEALDTVKDLIDNSMKMHDDTWSLIKAKM